MRRAVLIAALLLLLSAPCAARGELGEQLGLGALERAGRSYGAEVELTDALRPEDGLRALAARARAALPSIRKEAVKTALTLASIVLLCSLAEGMNGAGEAGGFPAPRVAGAIALTAVSAGAIHGMIGLGRETIGQMHSFSQALLPAMAACMAAGGGVTGAAARQMATAAFAELLMGVIDRVLVPLIYVHLACCCAYAAVGNRGLKQVAGLIRSAVHTALTTLLIAFTAYLTVSGAIAGTADAAAVKATRTAIAGAVPVVGRILSDAAETLLVSAGILKNAAGLFGMITVLILCLVPFLRLGAKYLIYKACAALCATVADERLAGLIEGIGKAFGMILGMTGACAVLLLIAIVSAMLGGTG